MRGIYLLIIILWSISFDCISQTTKYTKYRVSSLVCGSSKQLLILKKKNIALFDSVSNEIDNRDYKRSLFLIEEMLTDLSNKEIIAQKNIDTLLMFTDMKNICVSENNFSIFDINKVVEDLRKLKKILRQNRNLRLDKKNELKRYILYWTCLAVNRNVWFFHPQIANLCNSIESNSTIVYSFLKLTSLDSFAKESKSLNSIHFYKDGSLWFHKFPGRVFSISKEFSISFLQISPNYHKSENPLILYEEKFIESMLNHIVNNDWVVYEFNWFVG